MENIHIVKVGQILGLSVSQIRLLQKQGLLRLANKPTSGQKADLSSSHQSDNDYFLARDVARLKSRRQPSLAEEASQVNAQIQREVVTSVSRLQLLRRLLFLILVWAAGAWLVLVLLTFAFFKFYPSQTSDFFGYYYRLNVPGQPAGNQTLISATTTNEAELSPVLNTPTFGTPPATSLLADIFKPIASTSLLVVKAVDNQQYQQIVTNPVLVTSLPGLVGSQGLSGNDGVAGQPGQPGVEGPAGPAGQVGPAGPSGISLPAIIPPVPTLGDFSGEFSGDATVSAAGVVTLKNTGLAGSFGASTVIPAFSTDNAGRVVAVINTPISGLTAANFTSAGIGQWTNNAGYITASSADNLTNKTLTSPIINGIVATIGLTLPTLTAAGNIIGSGSPLLSGFGSINGLTINNLADGFVLTGGVTARSLTLTGANITLGSTIKPTLVGPLTIQSNGANNLTLDAGGAGSVTIGATSASSVSLGRTGVTTNINGLASANSLKIGGGATISKFLSITATFDAPIFSDCSNLATLTVPGAAIGDTVIATPAPTEHGIEDLNVAWNAYVSGPNIVVIRGCVTNADQNDQNPLTQTWRVDVWQH